MTGMSCGQEKAAKAPSAIENGQAPGGVGGSWGLTQDAGLSCCLVWREDGE